MHSSHAWLPRQGEGLAGFVSAQSPTSLCETKKQRVANNTVAAKDLHASPDCAHRDATRSPWPATVGERKEAPRLRLDCDDAECAASRSRYGVGWPSLAMVLLLYRELGSESCATTGGSMALTVSLDSLISSLCLAVDVNLLRRCGNGRPIFLCRRAMTCRQRAASPDCPCHLLHRRTAICGHGWVSQRFLMA